MPFVQLQLQLIQHTGQLRRALVETPFCVDATEYIAHGYRKLAEKSERRRAMRWRSWVVGG